jgi:hypothetical protein
MASAVRVVRRHILPLVMIGMAVFLWGQGSRREPPTEAAEIHVVTGTVAEFRTFQERSTDANGRLRDRIRFAITISEHPANASFRIDRPPDGGIARGARVRLEVSGDPRSSLDAAARFPTSHQQIDAVGLAVNGNIVYSAAADTEQAAGAVRGWRIASLVCWIVALGWIALLTWRHRAGFRALRGGSRAGHT